jgi:hypothetical protein
MRQTTSIVPLLRNDPQNFALIVSQEPDVTRTPNLFVNTRNFILRVDKYVRSQDR